jgi:GMP synthase (glutamine-hydrolysing)
VLIIQPGEKLQTLSAVPGDFADWARKGMGVAASDALVVYPHRGEALPGLAGVRAVVITGSSAMVTDGAPWLHGCAAWLREAFDAGLPVLGICFGHQLIAHALGGEVRDNPRGTEVGTVSVRLTAAGQADALFTSVPPEVPLHVSHRQTVSRLPPGAVRLASSDLDASQSFVVGGRVWGVQFHPEFDLSVMAGYIDYHAATVSARGGDPAALRLGVRDTPHGTVILRNFAALAGLRHTAGTPGNAA